MQVIPTKWIAWGFSVGFVMFEHGGTLLPILSDVSSLRNMKCQMSTHKGWEKLKSFKISENGKAILPSWTS